MNLGAVYRYRWESYTTVYVDVGPTFFNQPPANIREIIDLSAAIWNVTDREVTEHMLAGLDAFQIDEREDWRVCINIKGGFVGGSPYRVSVQGTVVFRDDKRQGFIHTLDLYIVSSQSEVERLSRRSSPNVSHSVFEEGRPLSEILDDGGEEEIDLSDAINQLEEEFSTDIDEPTTEEKAEQAEFELHEILTSKARKRLGAAKREIRVIRINRNRRTRT